MRSSGGEAQQRSVVEGDALGRVRAAEGAEVLARPHIVDLHLAAEPHVGEVDRDVGGGLGGVRAAVRRRGARGLGVAIVPSVLGDARRRVLLVVARALAAAVGDGEARAVRFLAALGLRLSCGQACRTRREERMGRAVRRAAGAWGGSRDRWGRGVGSRDAPSKLPRSPPGPPLAS